MCSYDGHLHVDGGDMLVVICEVIKLVQGGRYETIGDRRHLISHLRVIGGPTIPSPHEDYTLVGNV